MRQAPAISTLRVSPHSFSAFRKFTETHLQRGYTLETMKRLVEQSGLLFVEALDADTHGSVTETSERIYVIARVHGKNLG